MHQTQIAGQAEFPPRKLILVGAPNSGKTTLYNWMTGSRFRTVNYPGSTVEFSRGRSLKEAGQDFEIIDTPGVRSLDPLSPDEEVTIRCLYGESEASSVFVLVPVDVTQLERHLLMVRRLRDAGFSVVVSLTMGDLLLSKGLTVDRSELERQLGVPVFETDGRLGGGVKELLRKLASQTPSPQKPKVVSPLSPKDLEKEYAEMRAISQSVIRAHNSNVQPSVDLVRGSHLPTLQIDRWLMHPLFGLLFFFLVMAGLFSGIFWMAQPAVDLIDSTFASFAEWVVALHPNSLVFEFLGNGVVAGVGSVLVFLPQIVILFSVMSVLEDSGYLARAASLVDKPLTWFGLNGRSFVPLLSGYACAIPAMMAARTISDKKERWLTILAIPLMSCSARLPVWALLLGLLFPHQPGKAGLALALIFFGSGLMGAFAATFVGRFLKSTGRSFFLMELPPYRTPHLRITLRTVWIRTQSYLKRAGPTIVGISVLIWALSTFPNYQIVESDQRLNESYLAQFGHVLDPVMKPLGGDWRLGVGILSAFAAREVFVSTLAIVFRVSGADEAEIQSSLLQTLSSATLSDGTPMFTASTVIGLILYFMIALQCLPTVAVARAETGSSRFALAQLVGFTVGGYLIAACAVALLRLLGLP